MNDLSGADVVSTAAGAKPVSTVSGGNLCLLAAVSCWGLAVPLSKGLLQQIDSATMLLVQLGASVTLLALAALFARPRLELPRRGSLLPLILIGMLEPGAAYYLEFLGMQHTTALHAALILTLEPVGILVLNVLLFQLRRDLRLLLSATGASIGVLISVLGSRGDDGASSLQGDLIVFAGTMAASLYVSLSMRLSSSGSILPMLLVQQLGSFALAVLVWVISGALSQAPSHVPYVPFLGAAGVGIMQFAFAFLFYFQGVRHASGYWGVVVLNLAPVIGIAASVLLLGERLSPFYVLGGILCLGSSLYTKLREHALEAAGG